MGKRRKDNSQLTTEYELNFLFVIPVQTGIQECLLIQIWLSAFAGMTNEETLFCLIETVTKKIKNRFLEIKSQLSVETFH